VSQRGGDVRVPRRRAAGLLRCLLHRPLSGAVRGHRDAAPARAVRSARRALSGPDMAVPDAESYDFLIVGSGIAGLTFALCVAEHGRVAIVTKDRSAESNSSYAHGGVASVWSPDDSFASHAEDTLTAGAGLCHEDIVQMVVREGPDRIRELIALGC